MRDGQRDKPHWNGSFDRRERRGRLPDGGVAVEDAAPERRRAYFDEHLHLVLKAARAGTWAVDLETGEAEVSEEQRALYGVPPGSPFGFAEWIARVHPEDRLRVEGEAQVAFETDAPYASEFRIVRADTGEVRWIQARGRRIADPERRAPVFVGVNLDITEAKRAEADLREHAARLRATYDGAPVGLCLVDKQLRYVEVNARLAEMNGLAAEAHIGRTLREVVPDLADQVEPIYRRVLETGEPAEGVVCRGRTAARTNEAHEWLVTLHPVRRAEEEVSDVSVAVLDVTDLRREEERRRAAEADLQRLARRAMAGAMAGGIAHEVNQPLAALANYLGAARRLLDRAGTSPDPALVAEAREVAARAASEAVRAGEILRRLREFIGNGGSPPGPEPARRLLEEAAALVLAGRPADAARVRVSVEDGVGEVRADRVGVQQVVANLVRNALEATAAEGGPVHVTAARRAAGPGGAGMVEIAVVDDGPGLDPEVRGRLFEAFVGTKPDGMGLGLFISRTIVEAQAGRIWAEAGPGGRGTAVRFTLPAAGARERAGDG